MSCDIIIPVWNQLENTKSCIESLIKNTHYPYKIVIIDNNSENDTKIYLDSLLNRGDLPVRIIRNENNLGFVKAINQGFKAASAPYICILNNDTIAADGWLEEMITVAESDTGIGAVNPSSNSLGQDLNGKSPDEVARSLKPLSGKWGELGQCSGFCMLIKKEVLDKIGYFDEIYSPGYCEETDFCRRAQKAGYRFARAKAAYLYHKEGSVSFNRLGEREKIFRRNQRILFSRWGKPQRIAYITGNAVSDKRIAELAEAAARDNNEIWLFLKRSLGFSSISEHSNIRYFIINDFAYSLKCAFKILKRKRKKKMDIILSENKGVFDVLKILNFYNKAELLYKPKPEEAQQIWRKKSIYQ